MERDDGAYWVPEAVREYLSGLGFRLPLEAMEGWIRTWHSWMQATGAFYDYRDVDGFGRVYEVHRRSIHPAMRVCQEWGSLLLNDKTQVVCDSQECTDWLREFFDGTGFYPLAQNTVVRAFGMGTGAWALWVDADKGQVRVRHYDARMVIPLTWNEEGVTECAFVTRVYYRGEAVDQLQLHLRGGLDGRSSSAPSLSSPSKSTKTSWRGVGASASVANGKAGLSSPSSSLSESAGSAPRSSAPSSYSKKAGGVPYALGRRGAASASRVIASEDESSYRIITVCFDAQGNVVEPEGVCPEFDTGCAFPTFAIVRPAVDNTRVDMSPYGQSVFADAVDAVQAVDLAFDALINEVDVSKMRIFLSDVMFDKETSAKGRRVSIPFGKNDCTVFRKVMSSEDMVQEFAPALRTESQAEAFRVALQMLGDLTGFGLDYFDLDDSGYVRTATEVSSDNSALMRNIARHEHALEVSLCGISRAVMGVSRALGVALPDEGNVRCEFDDSIITDTAAEKRLAMAEVGVTMHPWEYRMRFYGESEEEARRMAVGLEVANPSAGVME